MVQPQKSEAIRLNLAVIADRAVGLILERHSFDLTICPECDECEFTHEEDCSLALEVEQRSENVVDNGSNLGPFITIREH